MLAAFGAGRVLRACTAQRTAWADRLGPLRALVPWGRRRSGSPTRLTMPSSSASATNGCHCSSAATVRRSLEVIDLSDNAINDTSARPLCHTLASCRALSKVKRRPAARAACQSPQSIERLAPPRCTSRRAELRGCSAARRRAGSWPCFLLLCGLVPQLDLTWNNLHKGVVSELIEPYAKCRLRTLLLGHNGLGSASKSDYDGIVSLAQGLMLNTSLTVCAALRLDCSMICAWPQMGRWADAARS